MATTRKVLEACKAALESYYGDQFKGLVVYGSVARNQAEATSDIDLLVLLSPELRQVIDVLYPVQLESEQLISARPVRPDEFERGTIQLYRNAKREGKVV